MVSMSLFNFQPVDSMSSILCTPPYKEFSSSFSNLRHERVTEEHYKVGAFAAFGPALYFSFLILVPLSMYVATLPTFCIVVKLGELYSY